MSWHYLQGQEGESLGGCCTGGEPLPPLRSKTTHAEFFCNGKLTESYLDSLSGTTSAPSMEGPGEVKSMLSPVDFLAKTSVPLAREPELQASGVAFGAKWLELSVRFDLATHSWRTAHSLFPEDSTECLPTLPRSGMMRSGQCWELMMSERRTEGNESGFWPTPKCVMPDNLSSAKEIRNGRILRASGNDFGINLADAVRLWPTPTKSDHKGSGPTIKRKDGKMRGDRLDYAVEQGLRGGTKTQQTFPTPQASDHITKRTSDNWMAKGRQNYCLSNPEVQATWATPQSRDFRTGQESRWEDKNKTRNLNDQVAGQLNPDWVEWLMGWPIGWTDLKPLAMGRFRLWLLLHGKR